MLQRIITNIEEIFKSVKGLQVPAFGRVGLDVDDPLQHWD